MFPNPLPSSAAARTRRRCLRSLLPILFAGLAGTAAAASWDELPSLPPPAGQTRALGVAGPFAGVHRDALIVAGGANFPDRLPWDGGAKVWWDDIWVLERRPDGGVGWVSDRTFRLPRPLGYGVTISTPEGLVLIGGHDVERCHAEVLLLSWDPQNREIRRAALPSLPAPLTFMSGAIIGRTIYVAGGQQAMKGAVPTNVFWALDLARAGQPGASTWRSLPSWPGPPRVLSVASAQHSARGEEFFLFSGRAPEPGRATRLLTDAYAYDPRTGTWRTLPSVGGGAGVCIMGAAATPVGAEAIWVFGGDRGDLFRELEAHDLAIEALRRKLETTAGAARAPLEADIAARLAAKRKVYDRHPGFAREILAFDTRRETWRVVDTIPQASPVTTEAVKWDDAVVLPSGEIGPGIRTPRLSRIRPSAR